MFYFLKASQLVLNVWIYFKCHLMFSNSLVKIHKTELPAANQILVFCLPPTLVKTPFLHESDWFLSEASFR